jgi:hypothetical protein
VRPVAAALLEDSWDGQVTVQSAAVDTLDDELRKLKALPELSKEQGERLGLLRRSMLISRSTLEDVKKTLALTFGPTGAIERTWGVPMNMERATAFIEGLFVQAQFAVRDAIPWQSCQLFVPDRVDNPTCADVKLPEDLTREVCKRWVDELAQYDELVWRESWGWHELIPVWRFHDDEIAGFLLPAIALKHSRTIPMVEGSSLADHWTCLTEKLAPQRGRDPLSPYHWCVALNSDQSCKDLTWHVSPPSERSEIGQKVGYRT